MCEQVGAGLATVLTDADYVTLNTTAHHSGVPYNCYSKRMYMGATSSGNFTWEWRTGDTLSTSWAYWRPGEPSSTNAACMRVFVEPGVPVCFVDFVCGNKGLNCVMCDA